MTDHPKSPGEAPFCFGFAFDVGQLVELADEAMLFSAAAPESEARRIPQSKGAVTRPIPVSS